MNRRNFITRLGLVAGGIALEQAIPFNRVWSFPKEIVVPQLNLGVIRARYLEPATRQIASEIDLRIGDIISIDNVPPVRGRTFKIVKLIQTSGLDLEYEIIPVLPPAFHR